MSYIKGSYILIVFINFNYSFTTFNALGHVCYARLEWIGYNMIELDYKLVLFHVWCNEGLDNFIYNF